MVAGPPASAGTAGAVGAVRADDALAAAVSTVDDVDTPAGRVAAVLALREQLAGDSGHYGRAAGASAPLPGSTKSTRSS